MASEINKCPACGALRVALSAQCPECGYDFNNTGCKVINELNEKFDELRIQTFDAAEREKIQLEIIRSFAIPHIKEEILDLLIYIQPKATEAFSPVTKEWRLRQKEVIQRAKMAFSNDKKVLAKVQEYEDELRRQDKNVIKKWWQKSSVFTKVAVVVGVLFLIILLVPAKDVSPEAYSLRFAQAVEKQQYDKALNYLDKSPEMGKLISTHYLTLITALIEADRIIEAENLYDKVNSYASRNETAAQISQTSLAFINYFLAKGNMDKAASYAMDTPGSVLVLKSYIANGDVQSAVRYFRKNSYTLTKYSVEENRRVLLFDDEVVVNFVTENNLLR